MKRINLLSWIATGVLTCWFSEGYAQTYDSRWRDVEAMEKKDMPRSVIDITTGIYDKAKAERNVPQMLKAYLTRAQYRVKLTPDSLRTEMVGLEQWAKSETNPVHRAVLNHVLGCYRMDLHPDTLTKAMEFFHASLADEEALGAVSAKEYRPLEQSGKLSERYLGDNLLDLLVRQTVGKLDFVTDNQRTSLQLHREIIALLDRLLAYYHRKQDRTAELQTLLTLQQYRILYKDTPVLGFSYKGAIDQLLQWKRQFEDLPLCAAVYLQLAQTYQSQQNYPLALATVREGMKRYPKSDFDEELQKIADVILMPKMEVACETVYPGKEGKLELRSCNLKGMTIEVYRLDLTASDPAFATGVEPKELVKAHGKRVASTHYDLPATPLYKDSVTHVTYRMPAEGIYVMKSIADGHADKCQYTLLYLSPLQLVFLPAGNGQMEVCVVDKQSGRPVPHAEVVCYTIANGLFKQQQVYRTNAKGSVKVPSGQQWNVRLNARKNAQEDFMPITYQSGIYMGMLTSGKKQEGRVSLFTDRAIYRPGQTVFVSGVAYTQQRDTVKVNPLYASALSLYDANGKEISKQSVKADEFGGFSAEFILPESVLPGMFRVSTKDASQSVRVEEYKRPTYEVVFSPYEASYNMGDTLRLNATAKAFSGAPVRQAQVTYTVTREVASFWRFVRDKEQIASGETTTDGDGRFAFTTVLSAPETDQLPWGSYYIYKVEAKAVSTAGETQVATLSLPVGKQSIGLQIDGLKADVAREKREKLQVLALNLSRQPVAAKVTLQVFAADGEGKKAGTSLWTTRVDARKAFVPEGLYALPSGKYVITATTVDGQGRTCETSKAFMLFSFSDKHLPAETVSWFYEDGEEFDADHVPAYYVGTSEKNVYLFYDVYAGDVDLTSGKEQAVSKRIHSERITLSNEIRKFTFPYKEAYGDGITVNFAFVHEGVLHTRQVRITRPVPDKKLNLKWETFRDKLHPGDTETWTLSIARPDGKPADARLMATLYDASLDAFAENRWEFSIAFPRDTPYGRPVLQGMGIAWYLNDPFGYVGKGGAGSYFFRTQRDYSRFLLPQIGLRSTRFGVLQMNGVLEEGGSLRFTSAAVRKNSELPVAMKAASPDVALAEEKVSVADSKQTSVVGDTDTSAPVRENFAETAFFYPNLATDSTGRVRISFTAPESLTEWKFIGFAHTRGMDYGWIDGKTKTSKSFMVQPNLPRFMRTGDRTTIATSLINLSTEDISGRARMQLLDPATNQVVYNAIHTFTVKQGETGTVTFACDVQDGYDLLICKITAEAGDFSDGEQHYLPILTDKQWVTETVPVQLKNDESTTVRTAALFNKQSKTATSRRLTVELTANPDWYAVQALPAVSNPTNEDALSWASAYYANTLASAILQANPRIQQVFESWKAQGGNKETLLSNLEKNQDLKVLLLKETPWVMEATDEAEQKRRIAFLFDLNTMNRQQDMALGKLASLQGAEGAWSWFKGMPASSYITMTIAEMLVRLHAMQITLPPEAIAMYTRALDYLKNDVQRDYEWMQEAEKRGEKIVRPSESTVRYLYLCALVSRDPADRTVTDYLLKHLEGRSADYTIYGKALTSIVMQSNGKRAEAATLLESLRQYIVNTSEMGSYFDTPKAYYSWRNNRIPTQVAAMEALQRIAPDAHLLDDMKQWLLKQKQVQAWNNPVETADAVYAFLCLSGNKLDVSGSMVAEVGKEELQTPHDALGYTRHTFTGAGTGVSSVHITRRGKGLGWGAVYAQYFEEAGKVQSMKGNGVSVDRELWRDGEKVSSKTVLQVGDRLTVRLTVKADRDMEFIQLKDERPACCEPAEQLSGYRWNDGAGYYRVTRDASTEFFFDSLRKGTYTIEYDVYIDRKGTYRAGTATVQSAYAPEFSGHSAGMSLTVQ